MWPIVQQLRQGETPTHARMGVSVTDATSNNGLLTGAGVESVENGSAAQQAGLAKGDVITKVDDEVVTGSESLVATVRGHRPGDKVTVTYVSKGKTQQAEMHAGPHARTADRPAQDSSSSTSSCSRS